MKRWPTKPWGHFCRTGSGATPLRGRPEYFDGGTIPWVKSGELKETLVLGTAEKITETATKHTNARIVPKNAVLVAMYGATVGETAILGIDAATNQAVCHIIPDPKIAHFRFIWYVLKSQLAELLSKRVGGAQPNISQGIIRETVVPLPPLAEQERIVKLLDEADELRKLRAQANHRTAALLPALFNEMFGQTAYDKKTIGHFLDEGWLLLHKDGNHGSLYPRSSDFGAEGIPFLAATCVNDEGTIDHKEVKRLAVDKAKLLRHGWIERGDVLLAHNASVGAVGYYEGEYERAIIGTSLTAFRVNPARIDSRFLWSALRDTFFQRQLERIMKQALRNQVPITAQRELYLRIPPLPLQKEFAKRVTEIRELEAAQAASRRRLEDLFQSMLHRAFQGEL